MGAWWSALLGGHGAVVTPTPTAAPFTPLVTAAAAAPWAPANPTWRALRPGVGTDVCLTSGGTLRACDGTPGQSWFLDPTGMLVNQADGTCLTAAQVTNSTPLSNAACNPSNASQQWTSPATGQVLLAANPNLSLDVPGGNATPGMPVSTWFKNGLPPQVWNWK